jgi:tetratricopeptide (TPR) repeat protein
MPKRSREHNSNTVTPDENIRGNIRGQGIIRGKLIDLATIGLLVPVLLPLVVVFTQTLYFESDPRAAATLQTISLGPTGMAYLVVASVAVAAIALLVTAWAQGKIRWWSSALVAAGIVPCLLQMPAHFTNRLHAGAWIAAASLGLAAAHLAQFPRAKRLIVTALIAMALPLFIQGAWYVYAEHPATVQSFMDNESQSIQARGLTVGSAEHAKYLTRLQGNDVIGAVGMSNVLGSITAAIALLAVCCFTLTLRRRLGWIHTTAIAALAVLAAWALMLTQSKGALLALSATGALAVITLLLTRFKPTARRLFPALCILLVLSGSASVLIRGSLGPPKDHTGERSLLFRFHYWQGAAQILINDPAAILKGIGTGHFKDRYEAVRNPISPETVSSTHNVFIDYTATLGLGGIAWSLLLLTWLFNAGTTLKNDLARPSNPDRAPPEPSPSNKPIKLFALLAAIVFGTQYYVQLPGLYAETAILWLIGTLGFALIATYIIYPVLSVANKWVNVALTLAAVLLLLHAQIEMTFFWTSSAAFVWVVLGAASAKPLQPQDQTTQKRPLVRTLPAACLFLLSATLLFTYAEPMAKHQSHLANAANLLRISGPPAALDELDRAAAVIPNDPTTTRWRVRLREEIAIALYDNNKPDDAAQFLDQAMTVLDQAENAGLTGLSAARRRGTLTLGAYYITQNRRWLSLAQTAYTKATQLSPNNLNDHIRLADTLWQLGQFDSAQEAYQRALKISDQYYLDPNAQLPQAERKRITARLTASDASP